MEDRMRGFSALVLGFCLAFGATAAPADNLQIQVQHENQDDAGGSVSGRITGIVADPADPVLPAPFAVLSTQLTIVGNFDHDCPAKAIISAIFTTNQSGKFDYVIGTSFGPNKHGTLVSKKVGNSYRVQAALEFDVAKSGLLKVHAIATGFPKTEAKAEAQFDCKAEKLDAN
jgi:hypothetical protein